MGNKTNRWRIIGIIILIILFIDMIIYHLRGPTAVKSETNIPKPDPGREAFYFDFYSKEWVYRDGRDSHRANDIKVPRDGLDIQEYLEEHIDGYKEDTYWGEEYEFNDKDE